MAPVGWRDSEQIKTRNYLLSLYDLEENRVDSDISFLRSFEDNYADVEWVRSNKIIKDLVNLLFMINKYKLNSEDLNSLKIVESKIKRYKNLNELL